MSELARWSDDRIDDLAESVRELSNRVGVLSDLKADMVGLRTQVGNVEDDAAECIREVRSVKDGLEKRAEQQHKERKADRRWMIGVVLTTASLIVAALAIFLG